MGFLSKRVYEMVAGVGHLGALMVESFYWLIWGFRRGERVRLGAVAEQMMQIGVQAIPIVTVLAFTIGLMLAIQGVATLGQFGAESQITMVIAISVTREFAPLITGILVAGRTASALAARIGSMVVSQEVDALVVLGVSPVRYLAAPALISLLVMMPILTIIADAASVFGGALFAVGYLDMNLTSYLLLSIDALVVDDIAQGLIKSEVFGVIVALVGVSTGFSVSGGAEGVGLATTRSVVLAISLIVVADMIFTYFLNR